MAIISSGIWDIDPTVTDGTQLAGYLNELVKAINTNQSSATRPPMIKKGGLWTKTLTGSDIAVMVYDGTTDHEIGKIVGGDIQLDSIWTEKDGKAVYDGDIEVNNVTVGKGASGNSTILGANGLANNTGSYNTAVGYNTLADNTSGTHNTGIGAQTLRANKTGIHNTALGHNSLVASTSDDNTSLGYIAGRDITTGTKNTIIGAAAGTTLETGSNNIVIGQGARTSSASVSNEVTIGNNDITQTRLKGKVSLGRLLELEEGTSQSITADGTLYIYTKDTNKPIRLCVGSTSDSALVVGADKRISFNGYSDNTHDNSGKPNMYMTAAGTIYKSTATTYSADEVNEVVDLKVKIRDKVINKLVERLDALENILINKGEKIEKTDINVSQLIEDGENSIKEKLSELANQNINPMVDEPTDDLIDEPKEKTATKKKKK